MPNGQIDPRLTAPTPGLGEAVKKIFAPGKWKTEQQMAFLRTVPTYAAHTAQVMRRHIAEGKSPEEAAQAIATATGMIPEVAIAQAGFFPSTSAEMTELYSIFADLPWAEVQTRAKELGAAGLLHEVTQERLTAFKEAGGPAIAGRAEVGEAADKDAYLRARKLLGVPEAAALAEYERAREAGLGARARVEAGAPAAEAAMPGVQLQAAQESLQRARQEWPSLQRYYDLRNIGAEINNQLGMIEMASTAQGAPAPPSVTQLRVTLQKVESDYDDWQAQWRDVVEAYAGEAEEVDNELGAIRALAEDAKEAMSFELRGKAVGERRVTIPLIGDLEGVPIFGWAADALAKDRPGGQRLKNAMTTFTQMLAARRTHEVYLNNASGLLGSPLQVEYTYLSDEELILIDPELALTSLLGKSLLTEEEWRRRQALLEALGPEPKEAERKETGFYTPPPMR